MWIEYREEVMLNKQISQSDQYDEEAEDEALGLKDDNKRVVKVTEKEIDEDFENLDLEQFDKV